MIIVKDEEFLCVIGGFNEVWGYLRITEKYSVKRKRWYRLPEMTYRKPILSSCAIDGVVYCFGETTKGA